MRLESQQRFAALTCRPAPGWSSGLSGEDRFRQLERSGRKETAPSDSRSPERRRPPSMTVPRCTRSRLYLSLRFRNHALPEPESPPDLKWTSVRRSAQELFQHFGLRSGTDAEEPLRGRVFWHPPPAPATLQPVQPCGQEST